ncbi:HpcH/HpaI aldolase/citrate lyase family protein [Sphingomonas sp. MMS24-J13]|uniref:HpcH/HpaI aldolase/citrate lyase family protein n=1 Tax=Sphingomonas sp. MMS24-J13 TaxID=3238686 RepID=UPI00384F244D
MARTLDHVRSALFLPGSNPRALAKARTLPCDLVIIDLEDAVADADKDSARAAVVAVAGEDWGGRLLAARINALDSPWHKADLVALSSLPGLDFVVLPKVEEAAIPLRLGKTLAKPLLAMIETPAGLYAAREIATAVAGLIIGPNDLAAGLRLPPDAGRAGLGLAYQMVLLAARAAGIAAFDGVFNRLDDAEGFAADAEAGRIAGFDGKSLIHPSQIEPANRIFGASAAQVEEARALITAFSGGAGRFRGRMIEAMHVETARRIIERG